MGRSSSSGRRRLLAWALVLALGGARAFAAFDDLGAGARAPGLGDAFTALSDDAYAVFYNPAGLARLERAEFSAAHSRLHLGLTDGSDLTLSQLAYAHPLGGDRRGVVGAGWQRLGLAGLYDEQTLLFSYGRRAVALPSGDDLLAGVNLKYLRRGFSPVPQAGSSCLGIACNQGPDPVLSGDHSRGDFDADLGLLYRFAGGFRAGAAVKRALAPRIGFADDERLERAYRLGAAYQTLWLNLAGELRLDPAPAGGQDKTFVAAAERYFQTPGYGQFGLRGSLGLGTRDWRQLTMGLTYRISKVQVDYAFLLPLGGLPGTAGTHRMALSFRFGAPRPIDEYSAELAARLKAARGGAPAEDFEGLKRLASSDQALASRIRALLAEGRYEEAAAMLAGLSPAMRERLETLEERLRAVTAHVPLLAAGGERWQEVLHEGITAWLEGRPAEALRKIAYAHSLNHADAGAAGLLLAVEAALGREGERVSPLWAGKFSLVDEKLMKSEVLVRERRFDEALAALEQVLALEPAHPTALARLGTVLYLQGKKSRAIAAWTMAARYEENPDARRTLYEAMHRAELEISGERAGAASPGVAAPPADPRELQRLYREGLERYAAGDKTRAGELFRRVLELDPADEAARKALYRLEKEP